MTARYVLCRLALVGVTALILTSEGLAGTQLVSDPNGAVLPAAPTDAASPISTSNMAQGMANVALPVAAGDPTVTASTTEPPATSKAVTQDSGESSAFSGSETDPPASASAPAPSWLSRARQFVAGVVLSSGK
jgi:hypothetical protein